VKSVYQRLMLNYASSPAYIFENVAISEAKGTRLFHYVSDSIKTEMQNVPFWYDQLGSFDRNHIIKENREFEPFIVAEEVDCDTLQAVLKKHQLSRVDLIQIDTEGFDYEILKQVDLGPLGPQAILYEHKHLSRDDQKAAVRRVKMAGYSVKRSDADTLAIRPRQKL